MSPAKGPKRGKHKNVATKGVKSKDQPAESHSGGDDDDGKKQPGCLRLLWRVIFWFFVVVFVIFMSFKIIEWGDEIRYKMMDARDVPPRFEKMRNMGEVMNAYKMLSMRPEEESAQIVGMLMDEELGTLEPLFLFTIAMRMYDEKPDEALFWAMVGRLRLEYDFNRCAERRSAMGIYPIFRKYLVDTDLREDLGSERKTRKLIPRVLKWDEEHPPNYDPSYICSLLTRSPELIGEARWPAIRYRLRQGAVQYLQETEALQDEMDMPEDDMAEEPQTPDPAPVEDSPEEDMPEQDTPEQDETGEKAE